MIVFNFERQKFDLAFSTVAVKVHVGKRELRKREGARGPCALKRRRAHALPFSRPEDGGRGE